jgi:hypothetical protein
LPGGPVRSTYATSTELNLLRWLLLAATLLIPTDMVASFILRGQLRFRRLAAGALVLGVALVSVSVTDTASAQTNDTDALAATLETRLAYVVTGNATLDTIRRSKI